MHIKTAAIAFVLIGWTAIARAADDIPETPTLTNAARAGWFQFSIASGRITVSGSRGINVTTTSGGTDRRDRLSVRIGGGDPIVDYELIAEDQEITIVMSSRNRLTIERKPKSPSKTTAVLFEQPAQGPVVLRVGREQQAVYQMPSLWHLLVAEPVVCRQNLLPLLRLLNREWDLEKTTAEIESALIAMAGDQNLPDKRRWAEWVEQLGDARYSKREAADRQLREAGRVVITFLQQLDPSRLDAEQQFRVRRIVSSLSDNEGNDSADQIAAWLAGDPGVWLALLSREDLSIRRIAAKHLEALLGGAIGFDPAADPPTRKAQLEQLRARIATR